MIWVTSLFQQVHSFILLCSWTESQCTCINTAFSIYLCTGMQSGHIMWPCACRYLLWYITLESFGYLMWHMVFLLLGFFFVFRELLQWPNNLHFMSSACELYPPHRHMWLLLLRSPGRCTCSQVFVGDVCFIWGLPAQCLIYDRAVWFFSFLKYVLDINLVRCIDRKNSSHSIDSFFMFPLLCRTFYSYPIPPALLILLPFQKILPMTVWKCLPYAVLWQIRILH